MKVLVLGAGGPAGVNTCRALHKAGHDVYARDDNPERLEFASAYTSVSTEPLEAFDLVMPQPDKLALALADHAAIHEGINTFLPDRRVIALCQDKFEAGLMWRRSGLRDDRVWLVQDTHTLRDAFLNLGFPFWLRARRGAGAKGAILATCIEEAEHWLGFWQARDPRMDFVAEEYLPGRDIAWTSIWKDGELITSFARQRLEYLYPHLTPEGLTGTPTVATVIHSESVNVMAVSAVKAVDDEPNGIYSVDLREDADRVPRPTEINAGRSFTTLGLWSLYGPNFLDVAVRVALHGRKWWLNRPDLTEPAMFDALPEGLTLRRHIDCGHAFTFEREAVAA